MKNLIGLFILLFVGFFNAIEVDEYTPTGHEQFTELNFVNSGNVLLKDLNTEFINNRLKKLKKMFWGSRTAYLYKYEDATYISKVVFSRSNKTREPFIFDYSLQTVEYEQRSVSVEGSISLKGSIKKKTVEGSGEVSFKGKIVNDESFQKTEKSAMKITVYPNKKITLRVAGDAKISTGFTKHFIFWICTKKGAWEAVDVLTSYFELVEEDA